MWMTPLGPVYLRGSHAKLFSMATQVLRDAACDGWAYANNEGWGPGPTPYADMTARQQLVCLAGVCPHVLSPNPPPAVTAWSESVIEAVYYEVYRLIAELEIEGGMGKRWRHLTHKAHLEEFSFCFHPIPSRNSRHRDSWLEMTQRLSGKLLWASPTGEDYFQPAPRPTTLRVDRSLIILDSMNEEKKVA